MLQQVGHILVLKAFLLGIVLHQAINRNNQGRHKLTLVGNDSNLVNVTVYRQFGFLLPRQGV